MDAGPAGHQLAAGDPVHGRGVRLPPADRQPADQAAAADAAQAGPGVRARPDPGDPEPRRPGLQGAVQCRHLVAGAAADRAGRQPRHRGAAGGRRLGRAVARPSEGRADPVRDRLAQLPDEQRPRGRPGVVRGPVGAVVPGRSDDAGADRNADRPDPPGAGRDDVGPRSPGRPPGCDQRTGRRPAGLAGQAGRKQLGRRAVRAAGPGDGAGPQPRPRRGARLLAAVLRDRAPALRRPQDRHRPLAGHRPRAADGRPQRRLDRGRRARRRAARTVPRPRTRRPVRRPARRARHDQAVHRGEVEAQKRAVQVRTAGAALLPGPGSVLPARRGRRRLPRPAEGSRPRTA